MADILTHLLLLRIYLLFMGHIFVYGFWGCQSFVSLFSSTSMSTLLKFPLLSPSYLVSFFLSTLLQTSPLFVKITKNKIILCSGFCGTASKYRSFIQILVWLALSGFISTWDFTYFFKEILGLLRKSSEV